MVEIYIDIDVVAIKSINNIITEYKNYDFIVSYLNNTGIIDRYVSCEDTN